MSVSICETCDKKRYCDGAIVGRKNSFCVGCSNYQQASPRTNADRIRSMTDVELSKYLCKAIRDGVKMIFPGVHYSKDDIAELNQDWLDWLRQEDSYNDR